MANGCILNRDKVSTGRICYNGASPSTFSSVHHLCLFYTYIYEAAAASNQLSDSVPPMPALFLLPIACLLLPARGQPSPPQCCSSKRVGGLTYALWGTDSAALKLHCKSECVYTQEASPGQRFCFGNGDNKAHCLSASSSASCLTKLFCIGFILL